MASVQFFKSELCCITKLVEGIVHEIFWAAPERVMFSTGLDGLFIVQITPLKDDASITEPSAEEQAPALSETLEFPDMLLEFHVLPALVEVNRLKLVFAHNLLPSADTASETQDCDGKLFDRQLPPKFVKA